MRISKTNSSSLRDMNPNTCKSACVLLFVVMILIHGIFNAKVHNTTPSRDCPPCHTTSQVDSGPSLAQTVHLPLATSDSALSLVMLWDRLRLDELWPTQGLLKHDLNGGINARQARRYE